MQTRTLGACFRPRIVSLAVASCFVAGAALANPTAPTVVSGTASFNQLGNLLQVTNSPSAIINWQSFSIGANEITRFIQQSAASAVLNRVTGAGGVIDPSVILGALQSNGRVFLINPSGIVFGAGAQVDVAGLVASSLNLSNADFLANRLRFTDVPGAGGVVNQGNITTGSGGNVYLIGSAVTNSGIITSPQGEVVLAAGNSVELVNPGTPNLRVEIVAPDNEARNIGQIVADAGRIGIYAGLINTSGTIRADSAVAEGGRILLKATKNATLEAGSVTSANGASGGSVTVQSGDTTLVSGTVEATGSAGKGGTIEVLGNLVGLTGNASLDASGDAGGGTVLVGGDFQGKNPDLQNAFRTYFGPDATIRADAITSGDGGKVIVWSDDATRAYGTISARGGAQSGDGGLVEVSGGWLDFNASVDTRAPNGVTGTLLLDPTSIYIASSLASAQDFITAFCVANQSEFCPTISDTSADASGPALFQASGSTASESFLGTGTLTSALGVTNVTVSTKNDASLSLGSITVVDPVIYNSGNNLTLLAKAEIHITPNGEIRNSGSGNIYMFSGWDEQSLTNPIVLLGAGNIGVGAPITTGGNVVLIAGDGITGYGISDAAPITANQLLAHGGITGVFLLGNNMVNTLAGGASMQCGLSECFPSGDFAFVNGTSLTIGTVTSPGGFDPNTLSNGVFTFQGISTQHGRITIQASGDLTVDRPVTSILRSGFINNSNNDAQTQLSATGNVILNANVSAQSTNYPPPGFLEVSVNADSAPAQVDITAGGSITVNSTSNVLAQSGNGGSFSTFFGDASAIAGNAQVFLRAAQGVTIGGIVRASGGNGGSAEATNGSASAYGGEASVEIDGGQGPVALVGTTARVQALAGNGGSASGSSAANAFGGSAEVRILTQGGGVTTASGTAIRAGGLTNFTSGTETGTGGTATSSNGGADAAGGEAQVVISSDFGSIELNGSTRAIGGNGGTPTGISTEGGGGGGLVMVSTPGDITVGTGGVITALGGNSGGNGSRAAGSGGIFLGQVTCIDCEGGVSFTSAGDIQIAGNLTATGGTRTGSEGDAFIAVLGTNITQTAGATLATGSSGDSSGGRAFASYQALNDINLAGGSVSAVSASSTPSLLGLRAGHNVTLGANISTTGVAGTPGWFSDLLLIDTTGIPSDYSGIGIEAANTIIGGAGILSASMPQAITLQAASGIGTQALPVLIQDGSNATGPDKLFRNTGSTGDIAVSFVTNDIVINNDIFGTYNNNLAGTFYITVENGGFTLNAPFKPSQLVDGSDATNLNGQSLVVTASGPITLGQTGTIATTTGNVTFTTPGAILLTDNSLIQSTLGGTVTLNSGSTISELLSGRIGTTGSLFTVSSGNQTLNGANTVAFLNATTGGGNLSFTNATGLNVSGVLTSDGSVNMTVNSGDLTIPGQINAGAGAVDLTASAGTVFGTGTSPDIVGGTLSVLAANNIDGAGGLHVEVPVIDSLVATNGLINVLSFGNTTLRSAQAGGNITVNSLGSLSVTGTVTAGGYLVFDSFASSLNIAPQSGSMTVSAGDTMFLGGVSGGVTLGSPSQTSNLDIVSGGAMTIMSDGGNLAVTGGSGGYTFVRSNSGSMSVTTSGDVIVTGGTSGGFAHLLGTPDISLSVGGTVQMNATDATAPARIESASPTTVYLDFTQATSPGGYFVNGQQNVVADPALGTGFYAGGQPAQPGVNFLVSIGGVPVGLTPSPSPLVDQAINQVIATTNEQTTVTQEIPGEVETTTVSGTSGGEEEAKATTVSGTSGGEGEKGEVKKELPVCK